MIEKNEAVLNKIFDSKIIAFKLLKNMTIAARDIGAETVDAAFQGATGAITSVQEGLQDAAELIANADPIEVLKNTEGAMIEKKEAVLNKVFDAKRDAFVLLKNLTITAGDIGAQTVDATIQGVNGAITSAQGGLQASKAIVSGIANQITMENAKIAIGNTQAAVSGALSASLIAGI